MYHTALPLGIKDRRELWEDRSILRQGCPLKVTLMMTAPPSIALRTACMRRARLQLMSKSGVESMNATFVFKMAAEASRTALPLAGCSSDMVVHECPAA